MLFNSDDIFTGNICSFNYYRARKEYNALAKNLFQLYNVKIMDVLSKVPKTDLGGYQLMACTAQIQEELTKRRDIANV